MHVESGLDLSPDGGEVVFAWERTGSLEIYSAPLDGDRIIQLTTAGRRSWAPRWSPDGRWVAFIRDQGEGWPQIALVDRDGEHERIVTGDPLIHSDVAWSPDARSLAYVASLATGVAALHVIDVATGEHRRLAEGPASAPRWSPDGSRIAFTSGEGIALVAAAGGDPRTLDVIEGARGVARDPRWSPDGSAVAFTRTVDGRSTVAVASLVGSEVGRIESFGATPFDDTDPVWRPDMRGLLYRHHEGDQVTIRRVFTISHADEAVMDLPGVHHSPAVGRDSDSAVAILEHPSGGADVVYRPKGAIAIQRITRG